ncbi:ion transporter [Pseudoalteromonas denitrificans]|uniref:Voltage-gated sodium channel n=1 Tax=Pseudoalteromonas denitrificans DSM 6059 TaxID=1123010 RepID=A0A1I1N278_9GAMM|nr:ion transporter [Pseudoalteromonas denitrificans]SFC91729.1 voltage-gated sodium channel [Pseudoalteromonas denitrificans DSM 6059]
MLTPLQLLFSRLDNSKLFQSLIIFVIVISALSVGAHTYELPHWFESTLAMLDTAITVFFLVEIIIRYISTNNFKRFFSQGWNIFDVIIVLGSLIPLAGSTILIARLLRVFRVLRLVSMIPELRMLVNALLKAIPRMGYIALLMFVIFYIYAAVGSMLFTDINETLWRDVSIAMLTLFRIATFEDWTDIMYETMTVHPLSWIYYLSFIFLTAFIFLNMMVGVVLEVMTKESADFALEHQDNDELPATVGQVNELKQQIAELTKLVSQK